MNSIRYIVVDCCALDNGLDHYVADTDHVVIPHALMSDIAGNERYTKHREHFFDWLTLRREQIFLPHEWGTLVKYEKSPHFQIRGRAWIDTRGTAWLRISVANDSKKKWQERLDKFCSSDVLKEYNHSRALFIGLCSDFSDYIQCSEPELLRTLNSSESLRKELQNPLYGYIWPAKFDIKYRSKKWRETLTSFPDWKAAARMSRIISWYSFQLALGKTKKFGNNYEDSAYAFTAAYAGYLATEDKRLIELTKTIFPHVKIITKSYSTTIDVTEA